MQGKSSRYKGDQGVWKNKNFANRRIKNFSIKTVTAELSSMFNLRMRWVRVNDNVLQTGFARYVSESDQINYNWRSIENITFWVLVCVFSLMPFPTMTHPRYLVETNKTLDTWQLHWTCRATLTFLQLQNRRRRDNQRFFHFIAIFFLHSSAIRLWRQFFVVFFPQRFFNYNCFSPTALGLCRQCFLVPPHSTTLGLW